MEAADNLAKLCVWAQWLQMKGSDSADLFAADEKLLVAGIQTTSSSFRERAEGWGGAHRYLCGPSLIVNNKYDASVTRWEVLLIN